jgi:hypothetical protein
VYSSTIISREHRSALPSRCTVQALSSCQIS